MHLYTPFPHFCLDTGDIPYRSPSHTRILMLLRCVKFRRNRCSGGESHDLLKAVYETVPVFTYLASDLDKFRYRACP
jgi:hypothetical protein